ncbi:hypothetical protein HBI56_064490 [Parastagonospora nodorum]|uniref:Uncharacterized protein n=1 Tax=Phaeosphaeria nodorum (strain SN15 / ATCC MYA-4574 / FGSC 10173) TaxID=321614 RepID=A0A7U2F2W5_PHANO|nr:hypothetical protein HBH56_198990 [Parastagonospora nodorum]QRC97734.1 hypothetical protein JI435_410940 [Parastagonospora nodorum SN15]KAH3924737.1 hypothetical protein HBH54_191950 [Parastagonospora nodorum]KAH3941883.1 hypothetical protein HBH53_193390 [Parastagonospora nodorum]KAH3957783.1 hypothetical protein HBH51_219410 [Parastagonospora nodorum]
MIDYVFFCLRFWAHRGRAKLSCALIGSCRCRVVLAHPDSVQVDINLSVNFSSNTAVI